MRLKAPCVLVTGGLLVCAASGPLLADQLRILNIVGGDNVVVMMASAGPGGCRKGQVLRTTGQLPVGNVLPAAGCNSEIAVFAEQNAMELITPVTTWTQSNGDVHTITLRPIIEVPVRVWLATTGAGAAAEAHVDRANRIYRRNKVGVQFVATYKDVSDDAAAVQKIGNSCNAIGAIRDSAWYMPKTLNIYYVDDVINPPELRPPANSRGLTCDRFGDDTIKADANIIFIGKVADRATLAHEIGHAFGLRPGYDGGHTNGLWGFDDRNVMWGSGGDERDRFTLGQVFRMNTQFDEWGGSMLIANGLRPGPGRACPPRFESDRCPPLALDWSRPEE
jgi:hypothetical protein